MNQYAERKDGEEWETNGRKFKRVGGRTIRVKSGDSTPAKPQPSQGKPIFTPGIRDKVRRSSFVRRLASEWGPKVAAVPKMLPALAGTAALGAAGAISGLPGAVMLGSIGAGGLLNKAMDRGSKEAKQVRLAMAGSAVRARRAAQRNAGAYFTEQD